MDQPILSSPKAVVVEATLSNFMVEVVEASKSGPVVVYFWSARNEPCQKFKSVLEKIVTAQKGAAKLALVDIEKNLQIAQQMGVQSVPAVYAFFRGQPVDGFMGAVPETQVKTWVERLVKATGAVGSEGLDLAALMTEGDKLLAAGDSSSAQLVFAEILDHEPDHAGAFAGTVRCLLAEGEIEKAKELLAHAPEPIVKSKELAAARSALDLAEQAGAALGGMDELLKKVENDPSDLASRFDLGMAYYAAGKREEAVDQMLEIVRRDRMWNEDAARKQLVKFFEAFGPVDPLTVSTRRRLSSILFS
jgi:putative thioredoxin